MSAASRSGTKVEKFMQHHVLNGKSWYSSIYKANLLKHGKPHSDKIKAWFHQVYVSGTGIEAEIFYDGVGVMPCVDNKRKL